MKHKHQPTADQLREQLALAAREIIVLRANLLGWATVWQGSRWEALELPKRSLWARIRGWFA